MADRFTLSQDIQLTKFYHQIVVGNEIFDYHFGFILYGLKLDIKC